jgi:hypothetical protein
VSTDRLGRQRLAQAPLLDQEQGAPPQRLLRCPADDHFKPPPIFKSVTDVTADYRISGDDPSDDHWATDFARLL